MRLRSDKKPSLKVRENAHIQKGDEERESFERRINMCRTNELIERSRQLHELIFTANMIVVEKIIIAKIMTLIVPF